jgi:hypothetical protein
MDVSIDQIVSTFIKIRDARDTLQIEFEAKKAELNAQLDVLKHKLLEISKETGATSFSTPNGTAYRTVKTRYWTGDWGSFYQFMQEHGAMELLEKRIHQSNMREFLENHPDLHPVNLNVDSEYEITVKRK